MVSKTGCTWNIDNIRGTIIVGTLLLIALSGCTLRDGSVVDTQPTVTYTPIPTMMLTPVPTETIVPTTPTPDLMVLGKDGAILLYVPAGEYSRGSDNRESDEAPFHTVFLDAFWIDKTEVTVRMYSLCVNANVCKEPTKKKSFSHPDYYGNVAFDNYPVIYVDWDMAKTYCEWVDRRLPTEAEWEKAARGTTANDYPWGNNAPNEDLLNYNRNVGDTTDVEKYPNGKSMYGALNMAGNVWEWVNDWYDDSYYQGSSSWNPLGPDSGLYRYRVLRGGSWTDGSDVVRSTNRFKNYPYEANDSTGFRCALSEIP